MSFDHHKKMREAIRKTLIKFEFFQGEMEKLNQSTDPEGVVPFQKMRITQELTGLKSRNEILKKELKKLNAYYDKKIEKHPNKSRKISKTLDAIKSKDNEREEIMVKIEKLEILLVELDNITKSTEISSVLVRENYATLKEIIEQFKVQYYYVFKELQDELKISIN
ncbi:MAG: hypothetical protein ACTSUE_21180 [Promethearchaeota archaeon]